MVIYLLLSNCIVCLHNAVTIFVFMFVNMAELITITLQLIN